MAPCGVQILHQAPPSLPVFLPACPHAGAPRAFKACSPPCAGLPSPHWWQSTMGVGGLISRIFAVRLPAEPGLLRAKQCQVPDPS